MTVDLFGLGRRARARYRPDQPHHLAVVPTDRCPACDGPTEQTVTHQDPLVRHGGYGATRTTTWRRCPCGWALQTDITETRPPRKVSP